MKATHQAFSLMRGSSVRRARESTVVLLLLYKQDPKMAANSNLQQGPGRFHQSTALELLTVREKRVEPKTREQTKWGVSIFTAWLQERGKSTQFEDLSDADLDELLGTFLLRSEANYW